jgi:two-component system nitrogen regulation response regulator GlnG
MRQVAPFATTIWEEMGGMSGLLVIDDDPSVIRLIESACQDQAQVRGALDAQEGLSLLGKQCPDLLFLDVMLPGVTGLELLHRVRLIDDQLPVVFISATSESDAAIEAIKLGALDFLTKPLDVSRVRQLVGQALEIRQLLRMTRPAPRTSPIVQEMERSMLGRCPAMLEVYKAVGRVAPQSITVLIRGESGTGKEVVARAIYRHSTRCFGPFLAVNCAALPNSLLESELFGHEKGAFTGAVNRRIGKFEQCHGGTIFLDEVGDMSPLLQAKLLRLLQEQRFERVGGHETIQTDVRIITATNRNLEAMTEVGEFRPDLYYRLNGFSISLPPLRERGNDVQMMINHFLDKYSKELGKPLLHVAPSALRMLTHYPWPGNVRELQSVLRKAMLSMTGPILMPEYLPEEVATWQAREAAETEAAGHDHAPAHNLAPFVDGRIECGSQDLYAEALEFLERFVITRALEEAQGNQSQAARLLGITRGSLRKKQQELRLHIEPVILPAHKPGDGTALTG